MRRFTAALLIFGLVGLVLPSMASAVGPFIDPHGSPAEQLGEKALVSADPMLGTDLR